MGQALCCLGLGLLPPLSCTRAGCLSCIPADTTLRGRAEAPAPVQGLRVVYTRLVYAVHYDQLLQALQAQGLKIYALELVGFDPKPDSVQAVQAAAVDSPPTPATPTPPTVPPMGGPVPIPRPPPPQRGEPLL